MIYNTSASILDKETERDRIHDRRRQIRDRLLCALEDAGRAMTPHEIARVTGLGIASVTLTAKRCPMYFVVVMSSDPHRQGDKVVGIDRHHHLKAKL